MSDEAALSRRERQIMDIVFAKGEASVNEIQTALPDPPAHSAVRTMLKILEDKGRLKRRRQGRGFVYLPRVSRARAGRSAMRRVIETFFGGSFEDAVSAHLADRKARLDAGELDRLARMIEQARRGEE